MRTAHAARSALRAATLAVATVALAAATSSAALAAPKDKQPLYEFATGDPVVGAYSKLGRGSDGVTSQIRSSATPGHAVTIWYVLFNEPGNCNSGACGEDDIFVDPANPGAGFNFDQIDAARISVVYGGDGAVANPGGRIQLDGGLAVGEVPTGDAQVVIGDPGDDAMVPGPVTGLEDAEATEVHIVLQEHGEAHDDPDLREAQLSGFNTACNPECTDTQFAVHLP